MRFASVTNCLKWINSFVIDAAVLEGGVDLVFLTLKIHLRVAENLFMTCLGKVDPLYTIFEQHLFNFQDPNSDRRSFIDAIVKEYLSHIRKIGLSVPQELEEHIFEELFYQVNTMLVKKIYGCLTIDEYTKKAPANILAAQKKKARKTYQKMSQTSEYVETTLQKKKA